MLLDYFWQEQDESYAFILAPFAAFDTTDHVILLDQLGGIGGRWHCIVLFCLHYPGLAPVGDYQERSHPQPLPCGVSQDLVLLFNMRSLSAIIHHHGVRHHQYADDTQFYISVPGELNNTMDVLPPYLEAVRV